MHEYDIALKNILTRRQGSVLSRLTGLTVAHWHNAERPEVRSQRADLLGETSDKKLIHVELQSTNDARMAARMLEYAVAIQRTFGSFPEQFVLYVGEAPLRMAGRISGPRLSFECAIVDIRQLDGKPLLESQVLEDNIIAVLARWSDHAAAVRRILEKIAQSDPARRPEALAELTILAGLRNLGTLIERELDRMPILNDIMDHEVIGRERKRGMAIGREEGERIVILSLIAERFGPVPAWARERLETLAAPELERLALRVLKARSLEDLLG